MFSASCAWSLCSPLFMNQCRLLHFSAVIVHPFQFSSTDKEVTNHVSNSKPVYYIKNACDSVSDYKLVCITSNLGSSIYDLNKKIEFLTPLPMSTCIHLSLISLAPCGRPHAIDMKYTSLA